MSSYFHTLTLVTPELDVLTYPAHQADAIIDEIAEHRGNYASVTMRPSYDAYNQWAEEESARRGMSAPQPLDGPSDKAGARKYLQALGEDAEEAEERAQDARAKRPRVRGVRPQQVEINDKARGQHRHRAVERGQGQENAGMPFAFTFSCTLEQAHAAIAAKQARPRPGVEAEDIDVDNYDVDQEGAEEEAATSDMDVDKAWEEEEGSIDSVDSLLGCWDEEMEWVEERPKSYDHDDTNEHVDYDMLDDNDDDDDDMYEYPHPHPQSPPHDQDDHLLYSGGMEVDDDDDNDEHPYPHLHSPAALDYQPIYPIFNPDIWRQVEADAEAITASATTVVELVLHPLPESIPQPVMEPVFEVEEAPPVISVIDQDLRRRWEEAEARKEEDDIAGLLEDEDEDEEGARGAPTNGGRPDLVVPQRRRVGAGKRTRRR